MKPRRRRVAHLQQLRRDRDRNFGRMLAAGAVDADGAGEPRKLGLAQARARATA